VERLALVVVSLALNRGRGSEEGARQQEANPAPDSLQSPTTDTESRLLQFTEQSGVPDFRTLDADRCSADLDQHGGLMMFLAASEMRRGQGRRTRLPDDTLNAKTLWYGPL
jgi:hypothetical protein